MDKRIRVAGIVGAIIFCCFNMVLMLSTRLVQTLIPEPTAEYGNEFVQILATNLDKPWAIDFCW